jgi:hypothetical protein
MPTARRVETEQSMLRSRREVHKPFAVKRPDYPSGQDLIRERRAWAYS